MCARGNVRKWEMRKWDVRKKIVRKKCAQYFCAQVGATRYDFENGIRPLIYLAKILKEAKILEGAKVLPAVITPFFYNKFCGVFCLRRNFEGCSGWFEGRHKFLSPIRIYKLRVYPLPFLQLKVYNRRMYRCWTRMPPRFFWAGIYFPQLIANRISSKYFSRTNQFH